MNRISCVALVALIAVPAAAHAQYWVEFNPGTCKVGPPPACVSGHWHPVFLPDQLGGSSAPASQKTAPRKSSEVSTDVEYESFNIGGVGASEAGQSVGARAMYLKTGASGFGGGAVLTYNRATEGADGFSGPATNTVVGHAFLSADLGKLFLSQEQRLSNSISGSAGASLSSIKPGSPDAAVVSTYGPFASATLQHFFGATSFGATLSYSVAKLALSDGTIPPTSTAGSWAVGFNGGYAVGPRTQFNADYYNLNGGPSVFGGTITQSFTETFAITAGAQKLVGLANFNNYKITLGTVFRAY